MALEIKNLPEAIRSVKASLRKALPNYAQVFQEVEAEMRRKVAQIAREREAGKEVVPIVEYAEIKDSAVSAEAIAAIQERGCCVVRGVFPVEQMRAWNDEIGRYVEVNDLDTKLLHRAEDKYFGTLASAKPQIIRGLLVASAGESAPVGIADHARIFVNRIWKSESEGRTHFDPEQTPVYADRLRRRPPGSASLGLSPHVDGGSVERWLDENFRNVYRHVFSGNWREYDAWDAAYRPEVQEIPSPAVCSMFRTFQGWTALTRQGKGDGTLQLIPIADSMMYILLRSLQDDVADDDLCGAQPGRALSVIPSGTPRCLTGWCRFR